MKKTIVVVALLLALVVTGTAMASSQGETLISLSYLTGTYRAELFTLIQETVEKTTRPIYEAAVARVNRLFGGSGSSSHTEWIVSDSYTSGEGESGDTVTLNVGAGLVWTSGSAQVSSGTLVDATAGVEVGYGGALTAGHRYLAGEQSVVTLTSRTAYWMVEGEWTTTSDGISVMELPFTDVPEDSWYYDAVCYVVEHDLFNGTSQTQFSPMTSMERRMMTTVLHRLAGKPVVEYAAIFSDVPPNQWYTDGIIWAGQSGVVSGVGNGTFLPEKNVARQEIAVILYNYARYVGCDVSVTGDLGRFSDNASVASWARDAMSWAVAAGIIQGSDGAVMPEKSASRVEVAIMLQRFQNWMET